MTDEHSAETPATPAPGEAAPAPATPPPGAPAPASHRERRMWWIIVAVGVAITAAVMVLGWPLVQGRLTAAGQVDSAAATIAAAENSVNSVDVIVRAEITPDMVTAAVDASPTIVTARRHLAEAVKTLDAAYPHLTDDEQRRIVLLRATAQARLEMLDQAPTILSAGIAAGRAKPLAEAGWAKTADADKAAHAAAAEYNKHTAAGAQAAIALNTQAEQGFSAARELFSQATTAFPEAKLDTYLAYVDQRLKTIALSRQSDAALAAGDAAKANKLIGAYNAEDARGVAMAAQLPPSPARAVADAYKRLTATATDAYFKARDQAQEADRALKKL